MKTTPNTPNLRRNGVEFSWLGVSPPADQNTQRRSSARGQQGAVHFFLQRVKGGLYVEREEIPRHGIRVCQSLLFDERTSFERWRRDDPIRFDHPLLYRQLERDAEALWDLTSADLTHAR